MHVWPNTWKPAKNIKGSNKLANSIILLIPSGCPVHSGGGACCHRCFICANCRDVLNEVKTGLCERGNKLRGLHQKQSGISHRVFQLSLFELMVPRGVYFEQSWGVTNTHILPHLTFAKKKTCWQCIVDIHVTSLVVFFFIGTFLCLLVCYNCRHVNKLTVLTTDCKVQH